MNHSSQVDATIDSFVSRYPAGEMRPVGEPFLAHAAHLLPETLVELYRRYGLGWFGAQELELVDPAEWTPVLQTWLGPDARSIPFAVTSFGHVYHLDADRHVQVLDPHFLTNGVVAESVDEFFGSHLLADDSHLADLRGPHDGAFRKLGALDEGELYFFEPILPLGGVVSPDALAKGDGVEHSLRTHRMVRESKVS